MSLNPSIRENPGYWAAYAAKNWVEAGVYIQVGGRWVVDGGRMKTKWMLSHLQTKVGVYVKMIIYLFYDYCKKCSEKITFVMVSNEVSNNLMPTFVAQYLCFQDKIKSSCQACAEERIMRQD